MDLHIRLPPGTGRTRAIYQQLRAAVLDSRLKPGDLLPPSRELAARLGVARTTVLAAYDQLSGEGYLISRRGSGTFVSDLIDPIAHDSLRAHGREAAIEPRALWADIPMPTAFVRPAEFNFITGLPDPSRFPLKTWRRLMAHALTPAVIDRGVYGDPGGHEGLRVAVARHVGLSRGVAAEPNDVVVTSGTQQAIDVVARVILAPGDRVAVEDPGYEPPRRLLQSLGAEIVSVPVDREGIVVDAIPSGTRLVYVTPSHQYPLGMVMSLRRRLALLDWANRNDAAIVEDDYDSEFRFGGRPIEALQTLDRRGRVVYVGSFSKTMLPTLRVGFIVSPPSLLKAFHAAKYVTDWHTSLPTQQALAAFIEEGCFARHLRKMRQVYAQRHELISSIVTARFADHLELIPSTVGIHLAAYARDADVERIAAVAHRAADAGVGVAPLSAFAVGEPARPGLLIGYGAIEASEIPEGMERLLRSFGP